MSGVEAGVVAVKTGCSLGVKVVVGVVVSLVAVAAIGVGLGLGLPGASTGGTTTATPLSANTTLDSSDNVTMDSSDNVTGVAGESTNASSGVTDQSTNLNPSATSHIDVTSGMTGTSIDAKSGSTKRSTGADVTEAPTTATSRVHVSTSGGTGSLKSTSHAMSPGSAGSSSGSGEVTMTTSAGGGSFSKTSGPASTSLSNSGKATVTTGSSQLNSTSITVATKSTDVMNNVTTPAPTTNQTTESVPAVTCPSGYNYTVIFMKATVASGKKHFLRGGGANDTDVNISHVSPGAQFAEYNSFSRGDSKLDWGGNETDQVPEAQGTPTAWTTNVSDDQYWHSLNSFGPGYWITSICMDCGQTDNGWFFLKSYISGSGKNWEDNRTQMNTCEGNAAERTRPATTNHAARCGKLNVFRRNEDWCQIDDL